MCKTVNLFNFGGQIGDIVAVEGTPFRVVKIHDLDTDSETIKIDLENYGGEKEPVFRILELKSGTKGSKGKGGKKGGMGK